MYPALTELKAMEKRTQQPLKSSTEMEENAVEKAINWAYDLRPRDPIHGRVESPSTVTARHSASLTDGVGSANASSSPNQRSRSTGRKARSTVTASVGKLSSRHSGTSDAFSIQNSSARTAEIENSPAADPQILTPKIGSSRADSPVRSPDSSPIRASSSDRFSVRASSRTISPARTASLHNSPARTGSSQSSPSHSPDRSRVHTMPHSDRPDQKSCDPIPDSGELGRPIKRIRPKSAREGRRTPPHGHSDDRDRPLDWDTNEHFQGPKFSNILLQILVVLWSWCKRCSYLLWQKACVCCKLAAERGPVAVKTCYMQCKNIVSSWKTHFKGILFVLVLLVIVALGWLMYGHSSTAQTPRVGLQMQVIPEQAKLWTQRVADLASRHPSQRESLWRALRASLNRAYVKEEQPAVVVLAASNAQKVEVACLTLHLTRAVQSVNDAVMHGYPAEVILSIDGAEMSRLSVEQAKRHVNTALDRLRGRSERDYPRTDVVVVQHLQQLQPLTAMLLHGFADNEHAPRKRALFLLCVSTPSWLSSADDQVTAAVEQQLWDAWGDTLGEEIFDALLGRIAGYVVAVDSDPTLRDC